MYIYTAIIIVNFLSPVSIIIMGSPLGIYTTRTVITYTCSLFTVDTDVWQTLLLKTFVKSHDTGQDGRIVTATVTIYIYLPRFVVEDYVSVPS